MFDNRSFEQHEKPTRRSIKYSEGMLLLSENGMTTKLAEMGNASYRDYDRFLYDDNRQELVIITDATSDYRTEHEEQDPLLRGGDKVLLDDECGYVDVQRFFGDRWNPITTGADFFTRRAELIKGANTVREAARWTLMLLAPDWLANAEKRSRSFAQIMDHVMKIVSQEGRLYSMTDLVEHLFSLPYGESSSEALTLALQTRAFELDDQTREEGLVRLFYLVTRFARVDISTSEKVKQVMKQAPWRLQDALIDASKHMGERFGDQLLVACDELAREAESA